jgi:hypothetical protein
LPPLCRPVAAERARRVNGEYIAKVQGHLVGPVLAALRAWDPVGGSVMARCSLAR